MIWFVVLLATFASCTDYHSKDADVVVHHHYHHRHHHLPEDVQYKPQDVTYLEFLNDKNDNIWTDEHHDKPLTVNPATETVIISATEQPEQTGSDPDTVVVAGQSEDANGLKILLNFADHKTDPPHTAVEETPVIQAPVIQAQVIEAPEENQEAGQQWIRVTDAKLEEAQDGQDLPTYMVVQAPEDDSESATQTTVHLSKKKKHKPTKKKKRKGKTLDLRHTVGKKKTRKHHKKHPSVSLHVDHLEDEKGNHGDRKHSLSLHMHHHSEDEKGHKKETQYTYDTTTDKLHPESKSTHNKKKRTYQKLKSAQKEEKGKDDKPDIGELFKQLLPSETKTKGGNDHRVVTIDSSTKKKPTYVETKIAINTSAHKSSPGSRRVQARIPSQKEVQSPSQHPSPNYDDKQHGKNYHRRLWESVYVPHNFHPYEVNETHGMDMRGNYTFYDRVNYKIYGEHKGRKGFWQWKKQKSIWYMDQKLDVHNNVVMTMCIVIGVFFAFVMFLVSICRCHCCRRHHHVRVVPTKDGTGEYPYLIRVHTGSQRDAGTHGIVHMCMQGRFASTQDYTLTPLDETYMLKPNLFKRKGDDVFLVYAEEELGDLVMCEFELECPCGAPESWYLEYITVCDLQRGAKWYFPFHRYFHTGDQGYDRNVLMKEAHGGNKLFYDNLSRAFLTQHLWMSLIWSENNRYKSSLLLRLCLTIAFISSVMAGNIFIYVRPFVDYDHFTGVPDFADVLLRGLMINVCAGMLSLVLELAVEAIEGRKTTIEERMLSHVMRAWMEPEALAIQMESNESESHLVDVDDDQHHRKIEPHHGAGGGGFTRPMPPHNPKGANDRFRNKNQNQQSVSIENLVPSPQKKWSSWLDLFNRRSGKNNPAANLNVPDSQDSDWSEEEGYNLLMEQPPHVNYLQSHAATVPPPPLPPPLSSYMPGANQISPSLLQDVSGADADIIVPTPNWNMNANRESVMSLPTILEESFGCVSPPASPSETIQNLNNNMGEKSSKTNQSDYVNTISDIWLDRLKDALSDSKLNLVVENQDVILEIPKDRELMLKTKDSLIESLQGLSLICKDRQQVGMLHTIANKLKDLGILDQSHGLFTELGLLSDRHLEPEPLNLEVPDEELTDIEIAWRNLWGERNANAEQSRPKRTLIDISKTIEFANSFCEGMINVAKLSLIQNAEEISFDGLKNTLKSFVNELSNDQTSQLKPHQEYFLKNSTEGSLDGSIDGGTRRHSDTSLSEKQHLEGAGDVSHSSNIEHPQPEEMTGSTSETKMTRPLSLSCLGDRPSITDIHEQMGLRPVTRKLSDSVTSLAYERNGEFVAQQAETVVKRGSSSRESIVKGLCAEVLALVGNGEIVEKSDDREQEAAEDVHTQVAPRKSILESVLPAHCAKLGYESLNQIASASLQSVLSSDVLLRFHNSLQDLRDGELENFTEEVVKQLYHVVRMKIATFIEESPEDETLDGMETKQQKLSRLLETADLEVKQSVIPVIVEHIVRLIEEEAQTLETIDVDLMMMSYAGQFVETIVTNAVLQSNVCFLKNSQDISRQKHKEKVAFEDVNLADDQDNNVEINDNQNNNVFESRPGWKGEWSNMILAIVSKIPGKMHCNEEQCGLSDPEVIEEIAVKILPLSASKFFIQKLFLNALDGMSAAVKELHCGFAKCDHDRLVELGKVLVESVEGERENCFQEILNSLSVEVGENVLDKASEKTAEDIVQMLRLEDIMIGVKMGELTEEEEDIMDKQIAENLKEMSRDLNENYEMKLKESLQVIAGQLNTNANANNGNQGANSIEWEDSDLDDLTTEMKGIRGLLYNRAQQPVARHARVSSIGPVKPSPVKQLPFNLSELDTFATADNTGGLPRGDRHKFCSKCGTKFMPEGREVICAMCSQNRHQQHPQQHHQQHHHHHQQQHNNDHHIQEKQQHNIEKIHDSPHPARSRLPFLPYDTSADADAEGPPLVGALMLFIILLLVTVGCFLGVIRYGVGLHQKIAHQWTAAVFIALFQHILILEPMKVLLLTYHMSFTERRIIN